MLRFNKLKLAGFKSFVDSSDLIIELGLTGVVGPNGCGKSNLVEALRWAMGETSAKQMRGGEMEDVIFSGTADRPARNIAEVVLHLDNSDRVAPAQFNDFDELEISRRIERGKGSTYRVNGKEVRARDVHLLFADGATGARSTAMVSQGRIGAVINAKPIERRGLLEEAAGITGLHSRRHEAELRLRGADTNLTRLDDILITLETQAQNLKKQARQAARYRNISDHIRKANATHYHLRWVRALDARHAARNGLREGEGIVAQLTAEAGAGAGARAEAAAEMPALRQAEIEAAAELQRLRLARDGLVAEEARIEADLEGARQRLAQVEADSERERALAADAQAAGQRLAGERAHIEADQEGEADTASQAEERLAEADARVEALDAEAGQLTREVAENEARRGALGRAIGELNDRQTRLAARIQEIEGQRGKLAQDAIAAEAVAAASAAAAEAERALGQARAAVEQAETARAQGAEEAQVALDTLSAAQAVQNRLEAEERALAEILETSEDDLWPPLIDAVTVEPGLETALGAALGDDLAAPADEAAPVHWLLRPAIAGQPPLPAGAEPLSKRMTAPDALARRLAQIGLVADAATGARLAPQLAQGQRLVSRDGGLWRWDGYTVTEGAPSAAAARLEQRNRLAQVRGQVDGARAEAAAQQTRMDDLRQTQTARGLSEQAARATARDAETALDTARRAAAELSRRAEETDVRLRQLRQTAEDLAAEQAAATGRLDESRQELALLADPAARQQRLDALRVQLAEARAEQVQCQSAYNGLVAQAQNRRRRIGEIDTELAGWQTRGGGAGERLEQLQARRADIEGERQRLSSLPQAIEEKRLRLLDAVEAAEEARRGRADALALAETGLAETETLWRQAETRLAAAREEWVRIQGAVEQAENTCTDLKERIAEILDCGPDALFEISGLKDGAPLPDLDGVEMRAQRLMRERDTMGPVNLRAEQELQELNEQVETLVSERDDLTKAIEKLRHAINELNREGRERLLSSFNEVDRHFQELFVRLFGGGRAHLRLTDSDDPLESGLEIMASPPGKRLQVLSLLSGGEQAMTALALLFAVFLTNPAPICVLDEVDAPLDDANVDRFCSMVEEMASSGDTRFLIITHHRMTMARMHRLFGVTMAEQGVSQLVSVNLQQAERFRETA